MAHGLKRAVDQRAHNTKEHTEHRTQKAPRAYRHYVSIPALTTYERQSKTAQHSSTNAQQQNSTEDNAEDQSTRAHNLNTDTDRQTNTETHTESHTHRNTHIL